MAKPTPSTPAWLVPGATVTLQSGGFEMTVIGTVGRYQVRCMFATKNDFGGDTIAEVVLPLECLRQPEEIPF